MLRAISAYLPQYDYVYLGDTARAPYGGRTHDEVYTYTKEGIDLKAFETNFEESFIYKYPGLNKELIENKFAVIENDRFRLTAKGLMICDEILPRFAPN